MEVKRKEDENEKKREGFIKKKKKREKKSKRQRISYAQANRLNILNEEWTQTKMEFWLNFWNIHIKNGGNCVQLDNDIKDRSNLTVTVIEKKNIPQLLLCQYCFD